MKSLSMTEAEARELLLDWPGDDGLEAWMAEQPWDAAPGGWTVTSKMQGWRFGVEVIAQGLRISAGEPGVKPEMRVVTG